MSEPNRCHWFVAYVQMKRAVSSGGSARLAERQEGRLELARSDPKDRREQSLYLRQRHTRLLEVLPLLIRVRPFARLVALEEQDLRDAFIGVDLRRQWGRVRDLERDEAFPLGLERRDVHD